MTSPGSWPARPQRRDASGSVIVRKVWSDRVLTPADIRRVARQYLGETQRTVVLTTPKAEAQQAPAR